MSAIFNIVLPVFGVILAGVLSRQSNLLGAETTEALNKFVYFIALPPLLFLSCARVPVAELLNAPFAATYISGTAVTICIAIFVGWLAFDHRELPFITLHSMTSIFSNTVYLGIPLLILAYGPKGATPAIIITLLTNVVFLTLSAVLIESSQKSSAQNTGRFAVFLSSVKNPLIVSPLLGTAFSWLGIELFLPIENFLDLLARGAGATALFAMGMSLYGFSITAGAREIGCMSVMKLVVHPLITWIFAVYVFELDEFWMECAVIIAALPAGVLVFVVAQRYNVYVQRSAASVVATTALSVVSLAVVFLWAAP